MQFDSDELTDLELDRLLRDWTVPQPSDTLRAALFGEPRPWWQRMWTASFRIPVPVACALVLVLAIVAWQWLQSAPATGTSHIVSTPADGRLRPVAELKPRIVRRQNVPN